MIIPILSKLASESMLSLYPIFVKKIGISMPLQLFTRLITYVAMASFFVDWPFIRSAIGSLDSIMLALINMTHVFFSYEGFRHLDSGVSFAIFNTYPLMILLIAGVTWNNTYLLVLLGLALFIYSDFSTPKTTSNSDFIYGFAMILLAALTEAFIYFLIRRVKTTNHWNHVFISYFLGAILITAYIAYTEYTNPNHISSVEASDKSRVGLAIFANGILGSVGYFLRFFSSYRLDAAIYAPLSYFGVVMSYVYGMLFNNETLSLSKVSGTVCILASNYLAPKI